MRPEAKGFRQTGVVFGRMLQAFGLPLAAIGVAQLVQRLSGAPAEAPIDHFSWAFSLALGLPLFLWGRSVVRRARTDEEVVTDIGFGKSPNRRGLAWVALVFSTLATLFLVAQLLTGGHLGTAAASGLFWFPAMFVSAVRYLRARR